MYVALHRIDYWRKLLFDFLVDPLFVTPYRMDTEVPN